MAIGMFLAKMMKPFTSQDSNNWRMLWNSEEGPAGLSFLHFDPFLLNTIKIAFLSGCNFAFKGIG